MTDTPTTVLPQDLIAQFSTEDAERIRDAIRDKGADVWLMWQQLAVQRDPMDVSSARFVAGWNQLRQVLGAVRMLEIAAALGIEVGA